MAGGGRWLSLLQPPLRLVLLPGAIDLGFRCENGPEEASGREGMPLPTLAVCASAARGGDSSGREEGDGEPSAEGDSIKGHAD